tara:strand:+ start:333 stop:923 length:591 start_codon:yes stop_codon:yes gene_type:complete
VKALVVVDIQNDFLTDGALEVPNGNEIIDIVNSIFKNYSKVVATKDWHPKNHISFASNHINKSAGEVVNVNNQEQVLWPDHCIENSYGSNFPIELNTNSINKIFYKGVDPVIDSYSGFYDNGKARSTGLSDFLKKENIKEVDIVGLATDYCVKCTAIDSYNDGFKTNVIKSCIRGISDKTIKLAIKEMKEIGINII